MKWEREGAGSGKDHELGFKLRQSAISLHVRTVLFNWNLKWKPVFLFCFLKMKKKKKGEMSSYYLQQSLLI